MHAPCQKDKNVENMAYNVTISRFSLLVLLGFNFRHLQSLRLIQAHLPMSLENENPIIIEKVMTIWKDRLVHVGTISRPKVDLAKAKLQICAPR